MDQHYINIIVGLISCIIIFFLYGKRSSTRHSRKIKKSKKVLAKINSFTGEYKEARQMAYLKKIDPYVFEELLLTAFEIRGYTVTRNKRYSNDGGIDGKIVDSNGNLYILQAKRYNGFISPQHLRDLSTSIFLHKASGGFFLHTGKTSKIQINKYKYSNIYIISGSKLINLINCNKLS